MDPALLKERQDFKKRALAATEKKVAKAKITVDSRPTQKPKKKKSKYQRPKPSHNAAGINDSIKQAAVVAFNSDNPARLFKAVVDTMKDRYLTKVYEPLSLDEILFAINLTELKMDRRQWLYEELQKNSKIHYYSEVDKFIFLPSLGHKVRNRHQLLNYLKDREKEGIGGVRMTDIIEALPNPERAVKRLEDDIFRIPRGDRDKEDILFYNNKEYELSVDEIFVTQWRSVAVDGQSEGDIEKYLQNVGLSAMQGESRKRKVPNQQKKSRKKARLFKVHNTHLDILKDYADDGTQVTTPTD